MKKKLTLLLTLVLILTMVSTVGFAEEFSDMPNDWSTEALSKAVENGLLTGYNGKLMPGDNLTRAQMAAIINRAFGAYVKGSVVGFTDVEAGKWYSDDMAKAVQMRTFKGDGNKLNPESLITREEAFVVMARAMKLDPSNSVPAGFSDLDKISTWAKAEVYALINAGYVKGSNGIINPEGSITRAEFAQLMHNMIKNYIKTAGEYATVGTGNVMVNVPGVVLKGVTIKGDLIAGEGIGEGDLTLDSVTIEGRLVVRGGGVDSIIVKGSSSVGKTIIVTRYDGAVRIVFEDGTEAEVIYVEDGQDKVIIEGKVDTLVINSDVKVEIVDADIDEIKVYAPGASLYVDEDSNVTGILVYKEAVGAKIDIDGEVISVVTAAPETKVLGDGSVEIVEVMSTGSKSIIDIEADDIVVDKAAKDVVLPEDPIAGGGGGGTTTTPIELISAQMVINNGTPIQATKVDGTTVNVSFTIPNTIGDDTYLISATFNAPVKRTAVSIGSLEWNLMSPSVSGEPVSYEYTITANVTHDITMQHFTTFGNTVVITVFDGTTHKNFTVNLLPIE